MTYPPHEDLGEVLFTEEQIAERVAELGSQISNDFAGETPLVVGVLKGSAIFVADLMRAIDGPVELDFLAVSFVRSGDDVRQARRLLKRAGSEARVMAKIERAEAIDRLDEIIAEADGILVARGDMGVELPPARVPMLQKQIIDAANVAGKPVMTATQMLESMRYSTRPTRAEASDVANAVLDGSDCLLLTAETAVGQHPVAAVSTMHRIIVQAEGSVESLNHLGA